MTRNVAERKASTTDARAVDGMLRDMALVLSLTRRVRNEILDDVPARTTARAVRSAAVAGRELVAV